MSDAAVIAIGAVSAQGVGQAAFTPGPPGQAARSAIADDARLAAAGLLRAHCARAVSPSPSADMPDRAAQLLCEAFGQLVVQLDDRLPDWRQRSLRVAVGSACGGMLAAERFFEARAQGQPLPADTRRASYFAPLDEALAAHALDGLPRTQILAACASSTIALGMGLRWLDRGACEVVLAGGYDAISVFVAAGFEALRATTASRPQPFRVGRDGMALGEGAALLALARPGLCSTQHFFVSGFGASADALHITAPDREGRGLLRAARAALSDGATEAGEVALVSAHATATPYNDAAEATAIASLCPQQPVVHPFKAQIGHTLGAAGVLETLAAGACIEQQLLPAAVGEGALDPAAAVRLLARNTPAPLHAALKLSAAFGGVTAALVLRAAAAERPAQARAAVRLVGHARISDYDLATLGEATGLPPQRLARIDDVGRLALAATAALRAQTPVGHWRGGAGVVVGHALATLDTNERFNERRLSKGPRWVDPRLFPATSPNAAAGYCAIAWGLTGPNFAVGASLDGGVEALAAAAEMVAAGDAPAMLVVAVDDAGPAARAWMREAAPERTLKRGAVALLLCAEGDAPAISWAALDSCWTARARVGPAGHQSLLHWLEQFEQAQGAG